MNFFGFAPDELCSWSETDQGQPASHQIIPNDVFMPLDLIFDGNLGI